MRRRARLGLLAAAGLPAIGAATIVLLLSGADQGSRSEPARALAAPSELSRAAAVQSGPPELTALPSRRPAPPSQISIPSAGIEAVVEPVAARDGAMRVPDVGRAGWYEAGPRPGEAGRAVIIGHLDRREGPGLFARVPSLDPGSEIAVTDRRGERHRYEVVGSAQVEKERFPTEEVYGGSHSPGGSPSSVLVLVTCGGPFEEGEGYRDNVLLFARAAPRAS